VNVEFEVSHFKTINFHDTSGKLCIKYLLDLQNFVTEKLPDDGTLVPKHAGVNTWYEVCFEIYFIVI
jgi:hypothetical protein